MVSQYSVPPPSLKGGGTEAVAAVQKQGRGGEAGVSAWCMGLHLLIQQCPCLGLQVSRAVSGTAGASLWHAQGPPARRQLGNDRLLILLYSSPRTLSPCPSILLWPAECQCSGNREGLQEKQRQSFQKLLWKHNQAHNKVLVQSWFLHRNMVTSRCSLQETHTPNLQICIEEKPFVPHLFQKSPNV